MQRSILLIGAGKSATACLDYLAKEAASDEFEFTAADADLDLLQKKTIEFPHIKIVVADINDEQSRNNLIVGKSVVISLLPPHLHYLVAECCLKHGAHLLNASYLDDKIKELEPQIIAKDLLFISELGLDPGIDHMSAMQLIHEIEDNGGDIYSFKSHCGGLIAPASDNNPWHYKISWNPRNIVMAGKHGAVYKEKNIEVEEHYSNLFNQKPTVEIENNNDKYFYGYYPNRNSINYIDTYNLKTAETFIRTTLRHPDFLKGWAKILALQLTDDVNTYDSNKLSIGEIFKTHISKNGLSGKLDLYSDDHMFQNQLKWLNIQSNNTHIKKSFITMCDVLQFCMENTLGLESSDKDLVIMKHEIEYVSKTKKHILRTATLYIEGVDPVHTAMAKTVGLPLAITALLILRDKIKLRGLHIPIVKEIYVPLLHELAKMGIIFHETTTDLSLE